MYLASHTQMVYGKLHCRNIVLKALEVSSKDKETIVTIFKVQTIQNAVLRMETGSMCQISCTFTTTPKTFTHNRTSIFHTTPVALLKLHHHHNPATLKGSR